MKKTEITTEGWDLGIDSQLVWEMLCPFVPPKKRKSMFVHKFLDGDNPKTTITFEWED